MHVNRLDHVAVEIGDFDTHLDTLTTHCAMRVVRSGERHTTKQRIAMIGDGTGFKLELIERDGAAPTFVHLAFDVDDVDGAVDELIAAGWTCQREAHDLESAQARTALMAHAGIAIQLIAYQPTSADIVTWDPTGTTTTTTTNTTEQPDPEAEQT